MRPDRKVYDSDIEMTPLLREIAHEYVKRYYGNFELMIQAKRDLDRFGQLTEGQYRPVLNTLRVDPRQRDLWEAVGSVLRHPSAPAPQNFRRAKVIPLRPKERDPRVVLPNTVKARFATTVHKAQHPVLHWIKTDLSRLEWRMDWDTNERYPHLAIATFCSRFGKYRIWTERPTVGDAWDGYRGNKNVIHDCKACLRVIGLSYLGYYPPDRNPETGEYLNG